MKFIKNDRKLASYDEYRDIISKDLFDKYRLAEQECTDDLKRYVSNFEKLRLV